MEPQPGHGQLPGLLLKIAGYIQAQGQQSYSPDTHLGAGKVGDSFWFTESPLCMPGWVQGAGDILSQGCRCVSVLYDLEQLMHPLQLPQL